MTKILLTGANGMVGRNILNHAAAADFEWLTPGRKELDLVDQHSVDTYRPINLILLFMQQAR